MVAATEWVDWMTKTIADGGKALCANCGQPYNEHWAVNYSDGPRVGREALMCPTAIFKPQPKNEPS